MDYYTLIKDRESIRSYDPEKKVPQDVLLRILEAGRLAPSAANLQPWEFIIVSSQENLKKVKECYRGSWIQDAPHILIVKGSNELAWTRGSDNYNSIETDLTIAMDHMILAAEFEGVSTCWIAAFDPEVLYSALELKNNEVIYAISPLGYLPEGIYKKGNKVRNSIDEISRFI